MRLSIDHLVIAAADLNDGISWAEERLGVPLAAGGKHPRYGTHNALLGLEGGLYLEVIAVDPDAMPEVRPRWFGLDGFEGPPRLLTWVCRMDGLAEHALPEGFERVVDLQRGDMHWRMGEATGGVLPYGQCHPGLIDWGETPPPPTRLANSGLALERLTLRHPDAGELSAALSGLEDSRVNVETAQTPAISALLRGADGREVSL